MPGAQKPHLRIVGGNDALMRMARPSREARWPPLRVVAAAEFESSSVLPPDAIAPSAVPTPRRGARSQALLAGLVVVMLSSVGQAIADYL